jgi:hypothetical protein
MKHCLRVLTLCLFVLPAGAHGERGVPLSIDELSTRAELVLHGTVLSKTSQRDEADRVYTRLEVQVAEVWKGAAATAGRSFSVVRGGGVLGEERANVSGQTDYQVGEEVVLFLRLNARGEGVTLGLAQGKFQVSREPVTGVKLAHNRFHGMADSASRKASAASQGSQRRLTLEELKQRVQGGERR